MHAYYKQLKEQQAKNIALQQAYKDNITHHIKVLNVIANTTATLAQEELITIRGFYVGKQKDSEAILIYRT